MTMTRPDVRSLAFSIVALLAVAVFIRLGVWQLDRLAERRAQNEDRVALAALPPLALPGPGLSPPTDSLQWRRVRLTGTWDFDNEIIIRGRAALGSPGVHVVTPLQLKKGPAVLVLRGWLPAADGLSADLASARPAPGDTEPDATVAVSGRVLPSEAESPIPPRFTEFEVGTHLVLGSLDTEAAERELDLPVMPAWVLPDSTAGAGGSGVPRLVEAAPPSDGSHLMYAIQWFGFATITLAGAILFLISRRRDRQTGVPPDELPQVR
jgi:surfeit locus 1 family protein